MYVHRLAWFIDMISYYSFNHQEFVERKKKYETEKKLRKHPAEIKLFRKLAMCHRLSRTAKIVERHDLVDTVVDAVKDTAEAVVDVAERVEDATVCVVEKNASTSAFVNAMKRILGQYRLCSDRSKRIDALTDYLTEPLFPRTDFMVAAAGVQRKYEEYINAVSTIKNKYRIVL